jgi:hypothetical protein
VVNWYDKPNGKEYNTRTIEVSTYEYGNERLVIEGRLTDHRSQETHFVPSGIKPPGIMHQIVVKLLVDKTTLEIVDVHGELPVFPNEDCLDTISGTESLKGLRITSGFTAKVKALGGNGKGCSHMIELLISMAYSALQGQIAYRQAESPISTSETVDMMADSCWTWRSEGPLVNLLKERLEEELRHNK